MIRHVSSWHLVYVKIISDNKKEYRVEEKVAIEGRYGWLWMEGERGGDDCVDRESGKNDVNRDNEEGMAVR